MGVAEKQLFLDPGGRCHALPPLKPFDNIHGFLESERIRLDPGNGTSKIHTFYPGRPLANGQTDRVCLRAAPQKPAK
jgi:hypothetical protein